VLQPATCGTLKVFSKGAAFTRANDGQRQQSGLRREQQVSIQTKTLALLLALSIAIATAGTAFAQDIGYQNGGEEVAGTLQGPSDQAGAVQTTTAAPSGDGGGALPFTGLDVALILGVGGVLVAAGLVTRRLTRSVDAA
jgi:hypothetical protein